MNFYDKQNNEIIRFLMEQNTILQEQIRILTESSKQKDDIISELTTIISSQSVQYKKQPKKTLLKIFKQTHK